MIKAEFKVIPSMDEVTMLLSSMAMEESITSKVREAIRGLKVRG